MASTAAVLNILVTANTAQATTGLARTNAQLKSTSAQATATTAATTKASTGMRALGTAAKFGAGIGVAALGVALKKSIDEAREAQKATAQTRAVLKSMGNEAGITAAGVEKLANKISTYAGVDDEAIQQSENLLLTFKNLRNEAGKGNDIFTQTTALVVDMSAALGQDLKSSSIQLGKALNDPTVGLTALRRVGVSFSETQTENIKKMFESGQQMKAQKTILAELNAEFRGSAKAQADPWDKLGVALENLQETVGTALLPTFSKWANLLAKFLHQMNTGKKAGGDFSKALKVIGNVLAFLWPLMMAFYKYLIKLGKALVDIGKFGIKAFNSIKNAAKDVWDWFKGAWQNIKGFLTAPFENAANAIIDFLNVIIKAINVLPGVPDIGLIGSVGGGPSKQSQQAKKKGGGRQKGGLAGMVPGMGAGDKVHMSAMVEPGEGVFVMNRNAMGALQAMNDSVPRFAGGGILDLAKKTPAGKVVSGAISGAGDIIGKLPSPGDLPDWMAGLGTWVIDQVKEFIKDKAGGILGFGGGSPSIVAVGHILQNAGYQVGEHPAFGGVSGGHVAGSAHYAARAIDVNWANVAQEPSKLDLAAKALMGVDHSQIIWRNKDLDTGAFIPEHLNHLHFAMQRGGIVDDFARAVIDTKAPKSSALALFMAGMAESGMRDLGYGDSTSEGVLQLLSSTASSMGLDPHNEYAVAKAFLTRGYWGKGSAIGLQNRAPAMIAHLVQGNATGTGVYSAQRAAAISLMRASGLKWDKDGRPMIAGTTEKKKNKKKGKKGKKNKKEAAEDVLAEDVAADDPFAAINELIGEQNLLKLQNYQLGMAQHPLLGLANPAMPGLSPMLSAAAGAAGGAMTVGALAPSVHTPVSTAGNLSVTGGWKRGRGATGGLASTGVTIVIEDGAVNANRIKKLSGKEANRKLKRAARRGNRRLPSGGGGGP